MIPEEEPAVVEEGDLFGEDPADFAEVEQLDDYVLSTRRLHAGGAVV